VPAGEGTSAVRVHPSGRFAYAINEEGSGVLAYTIDARTGMLSPAGTFLQDDPPADLCFHPDGTLAYGNLPGARVAIYSVDLDNGTLEQEDTVLVGTVAPGLAVAPSGQLLFVAHTDDKVSSYEINVDTPALTLINTVDTAASPRSMAVAPSGDFLYVAGQDGEITVHAVETTGSLQDGEITPGGIYVGTIAVAPSGRLAYAVTVRTGTGYEVQAFTIEAGALTQRGISPAPDGAEIFDLAISPSGKHVYITHTGLLTCYTIGAGGTLFEGTTTAVSNPRGITIVDMPVSS
jgi:6-phosphogluconolactonase (cycloisomerase 2 family)